MMVLEYVGWEPVVPVVALILISTGLWVNGVPPAISTARFSWSEGIVANLLVVVDKSWASAKSEPFGANCTV